jgi:hypothetical protein
VIGKGYARDVDTQESGEQTQREEYDRHDGKYVHRTVHLLREASQEFLVGNRRSFPRGIEVLDVASGPVSDLPQAGSMERGDPLHILLL